MQTLRGFIAVLMTMILVGPVSSFAASHREAPITALDRAADITDWYAFVSYDDPSKVTFLLNVDPLLDPGNGPNYFPFDPDIVYAMKIDNNNDAVADVTFEFRFQTEIRAPGLFTGFIGAGSGISAPGNAPQTAAGAPAPQGLVIPPAITALDGKGSEGFSLRQTYTITLVKGSGESAVRTDITGGKKLFAVPSNVGPRTMPNYTALAKQGIYSLSSGMRSFAGTVDDPFYIDLGGVFDSLNFRGNFPSGVAGVLTSQQDGNDKNNFAPDSVAGYNVNTIALEVPIAMLLRDSNQFPASDPRSTIGTWATTSRPRTTVRRSPDETASTSMEPTQYRQIQRMGNPLINEVIIGTGSKDKWSMGEPKDDSQYANFALDPVLARAINAVYGIPVPNAPRTDLLLLVQYLPPIAAAGTPKGPIADMLRLNTAIPPASSSSRSRLGVLGGDLAGWPNGRRVSDDVTDIALRAVAGVLAGAPFNGFPHNSIGDGVNMNDVPYQETFPYVAFAQPGTRIVKMEPGATPKDYGSIECVNNPLECVGK
ncbi:MAG TPA: DUF4331 domain-containing protein [Bryobacteraceae bacterium]|nr:DUF4331 domain-containing protein [Bryobacteraceae bacterium]